MALALILGGCGSSGHDRAVAHVLKPQDPSAPSSRALKHSARHRKVAHGAYPEALVTAETENRVFAVDVGTGRVIDTATLAPDPEDVAASPGAAVVTSARSGTVAVLEPFPRVRRVIRGFVSPHIVTISPDGGHAYVTDDADGTVSVIALFDAKRTATVTVGSGAHHMAFSPDQRRLWIALGESARTIVILDTSNISHPRVIGRFDPGFAVHDLHFSPDGRRIWLTSATGPDVSVLDARTRRVLFRVPVGPPPQHLAFAGRNAYITSGYGSTIEKVALSDGRALKRSPAPYGSFELDARYGYVVTASLLTGTLTIYTPQLRRLRALHLAPETRDVSLSLGYPQ